MVKELILIRHGKAEERSAELNDSERKLTRKGERELKAMFSVLGPYIAGRKKAEIWSSRLERAAQTAAILSREIGSAKLAFRSFISEGDFESMSREVERSGGASLIVIVGHEPHLSAWTEKITGVLPDFRKGAALSISLNSVKPLKGELGWQFNPARHADGKLVPQLTFPSEDGGKPEIDAEGTLGGEMNRVFMFCLKEIAAAGAEFMQDPDDPETAHKYRVKIRQFRSVLSFVKPELGRKGFERVQAGAKDLAGRFTYLRQVDVMAEKLGGSYPALLAVLKEEREKEKKKVCRGLESADAAKLLFEMLQWIEKDPLRKSKEADKPIAGFAEARVGEWMERFREGLQTVDSKDEMAIHALRIQGKKLRYIMSLLEPMLKEKQAKLIPGLKDMQDRLGLICDIQFDIPVLEKLKAGQEDPEAVDEINEVIKEKVRKSAELMSGLPREIS
jgi:CHAD domain-containing protein/phosphohistidine phosphatase SixA